MFPKAYTLMFRWNSLVNSNILRPLHLREKVRHLDPLHDVLLTCRWSDSALEPRRSMGPWGFFNEISPFEDWFFGGSSKIRISSLPSFQTEISPLWTSWIGDMHCIGLSGQPLRLAITPPLNGGIFCVFCPPGRTKKKIRERQLNMDGSHIEQS